MLGGISNLEVYAFDGPTHKYVTKTSLEALLELESKYSDFYSEDVRKMLLEYSVKPDEDEIEGGFKYHFYNPATECNFMGEKESALTKFTGHYNNAIKKYNAGNKSLAWEELGRSLHFLEDLNTPVHTNYEDLLDAGIMLFMHLEFEKRCVEIQDNIKIKPIVKESLKYYLINSTNQIGKTSAYIAADNFFSLENEIDKRDEIVKGSIMNAQTHVTGVLYKFYNDVNVIKKSL